MALGLFKRGGGGICADYRSTRSSFRLILSEEFTEGRKISLFAQSIYIVSKSGKAHMYLISYFMKQVRYTLRFWGFSFQFIF